MDTIKSIKEGPTKKGPDHPGVKEMMKYRERKVGMKVKLEEAKKNEQHVTCTLSVLIETYTTGYPGIMLKNIQSGLEDYLTFQARHNLF